jgi:hypothetical protein
MAEFDGGLDKFYEKVLAPPDLWTHISVKNSIITPDDKQNSSGDKN